MDNSALTAIEWFFGYGGNHLGLKRVIPNLRTVAACEIEAYAIANMVAKMEAGLLDSFPVWSDCKTFPCEPFRNRIDLFVASYPCQGFSAAGQRKGEEDSRYLWPWVRRAIGIIRPRYCFLENVEGHISLGLREVLTDLACLGYRVENSRGEPTWGIFSAEECGASHRRKRVFILAELANAKSERKRSECGSRSDKEAETARRRGYKNRESDGAISDCTILADPMRGCEWRGQQDGNATRSRQKADNDSGALAYRHGAWKLQSEGMLSGLGGRTGDRRKELGDTEGKRDGSRCLPIGTGKAITIPSGAMSELEHANQQGLERRGVRGCECEDERASGERERALLPQYPPGPNDFEGWRRVLAIRPDLAPSLSEAESALCGVADGSANRVDRLRLCGNGVVPDTAQRAFRVLYKRLIEDQ